MRSFTHTRSCPCPSRITRLILMFTATLCNSFYHHYVHTRNFALSFSKYPLFRLTLQCRSVMFRCFFLQILQAHSPRPLFSLSSERRTDASFSSRRGVARARGAAAAIFAADAGPLHASMLGVLHARSAVVGFPSDDVSAAEFASAVFVAATVPPGAWPVASALRRLALSSTPRTRAAKLREHSVSAASAASGDACSKRYKCEWGTCGT